MLHICYNVVVVVAAVFFFIRSHFILICVLFLICKILHTDEIALAKSDNQRKKAAELRIKLEERHIHAFAAQHTQKCGIFVRLFGPSFFLLFISISFATWIYDYFYGEISTLFLTVASERASERVGLIIIKIPWLVYHTIWFDVFIRFHVLVSFILCYFRFFVCLFCCCCCCVFGAVIPHCNVRVLFLRHFKLVFHQLYGVFLCLCVVLGSILTSQTKNGSGECYFSVFGVAEID